jgi:hypothetical protein
MVIPEWVMDPEWGMGRALISSPHHPMTMRMNNPRTDRNRKKGAEAPLSAFYGHREGEISGVAR